jgi:hypothetical protein
MLHKALSVENDFKQKLSFITILPELWALGNYGGYT